MVKAKLWAKDTHTEIHIQRAKYKHWFMFGAHRPTDLAFRDALDRNEIEWKIIEPKLF